MYRNRTLFIVFALFVAGLAIAAMVRSKSSDENAIAQVTALSQAAASPNSAGGRSAAARSAVRFVDRAGTTRSLDDFTGKVVLLNFWATWCAPCRKEMRSLDRLQQTLGGKDFEVLAVSVDEGGVPAVERFYRDMALGALGVYVDRDNDAATAFGVQGIPTTVLVDAQRREVWRIAGAVAWDKPEVIESIRRDVERHLQR